MLVVRINEAMDKYRDRTGHHMTWKELAAQAGVTVVTVRGMRRVGYNTTLASVEAVAAVLGMKALDLLDEIPRSRRRKKKTGQKKGGKTTKGKPKRKP